MHSRYGASQTEGVLRGYLSALTPPPTQAVQTVETLSQAPAGVGDFKPCCISSARQSINCCFLPLSSPSLSLSLPLSFSQLSQQSEARLLAALAADTERLSRLEGRVVELWQSVQQGEQRQEEQRGQTLQHYQSLQEQLRTQTDRHTLGLWVSDLLEDKLSALRADLEQQANQRTEVSPAGREEASDWSQKRRGVYL